MGQKLEEEETKGPRPKELGYLRPPLRFGEVLAVVDIGAEELMHGLSRHPQIETIRVYGESGYVTTMDRTFRPVSREKYSLADLF